MKKVICFFICVCFMMQSVVVFAEGNTDLGLNAKSAILMEESTGNILYESNPDERLPIASVTKVLLILRLQVRMTVVWQWQNILQAVKVRLWI